MNHNNIQQLKGELVSYLNGFSSHGFTLGLNFLGGVPGDIVSTWDEEWLSEYQENDYVMYDPVVIWGTQNEGITTWDQLHPIFRNQKVDVIGLARERGMPNGSVVSVNVNRKRSILGISHISSQLSFEQQDGVIGRMAALTCRLDREPSAVISEKAKSYLHLASKGLTDSEIAKHNQVTPGAVHQLRVRTLEKLNAKTLAQAILTAYKSGLID